MLQKKKKSGIPFRLYDWSRLLESGNRSAEIICIIQELRLAEEQVFGFISLVNGQSSVQQIPCFRKSGLKLPKRSLKPQHPRLIEKTRISNRARAPKLLESPERRIRRRQ